MAARDEVLDDAVWKLLDGEPVDALARVKAAARMSAPRGMPERAWLIAAAATCVRPDLDQRDYVGWRRDARVIKYCALNNAAAAGVEK
jgi:hypothetical protein